MKNSEDPEEILHKRHFIRINTVFYDKLDLQSRKYNIFWGELIDKYKDKCEFKDSIHRLRNAQISTYSPHIFLKFCQSKVGVVKKFFSTQKTWT